MLQEHKDTLADLTRDADPEQFSDLRLDLKGLGLTNALPHAALELLAWAESFDLSGNSFSNIQPGSALAHMVYEMHRWRDAKINWTGKQLEGYGEAAKYLYSCSELTVSRATLKMPELFKATTLDLSGQSLEPQDAEVIASILPLNK